MKIFINASESILTKLVRMSFKKENSGKAFYHYSEIAKTYLESGVKEEEIIKRLDTIR